MGMFQEEKKNGGFKFRATLSNFKVRNYAALLAGVASASCGALKSASNSSTSTPMSLQVPNIYVHMY